MTTDPHKRSGLKLGLASLVLVMFVFIGVFVFGPERDQVEPGPIAPEQRVSVLDILEDAPTRSAVEALRAAAPATYAALDAEAAYAQADGASAAEMSGLVLEALFSQFQLQASAIKSADSTAHQDILAGFAGGLKRLKSNNSAWCEGSTVADYLTQNEDELVPSLLSEFPYQSAQYEWAMEWMTVVLNAAKQGQVRPLRYQKPGFRDETLLQQEGLALGSEQWALALQIAAFANSEGTSYAKMKEVIAGMDVCDLGIAVETVSARLPADVRGRIWSDLMPEIMVGNTPYVMWRVTDYFFIG